MAIYRHVFSFGGKEQDNPLKNQKASSGFLNRLEIDKQGTAPIKNMQSNKMNIIQAIYRKYFYVTPFVTIYLYRSIFIVCVCHNVFCS